MSAEPDPAASKDMLLYDYSKHLLSLALLGIGGIVTLSQSPQGLKVPGPVTALLVVFFALSGFFALSCTATILRARRADRAVPASAWLTSRAAMLFLGTGVGGFLVSWIRMLL